MYQVLWGSTLKLREVVSADCNSKGSYEMRVQSKSVSSFFFPPPNSSTGTVINYKNRVTHGDPVH